MDAPAKSVAPAGGFPPLADRLRGEIADAIVSGDMAPGVALDEMAQRFNASRTPVREAIRLLAGGPCGATL